LIQKGNNEVFHDAWLFASVCFQPLHTPVRCHPRWPPTMPHCAACHRLHHRILFQSWVQAPFTIGFSPTTHTSCRAQVGKERPALLCTQILFEVQWKGQICFSSLWFKKLLIKKIFFYKLNKVTENPHLAPSYIYLCLVCNSLVKTNTTVSKGFVAKSSTVLLNKHVINELMKQEN